MANYTTPASSPQPLCKLLPAMITDIWTPDGGKEPILRLLTNPTSSELRKSVCMQQVLKDFFKKTDFCDLAKPGMNETLCKVFAGAGAHRFLSDSMATRY